MKELLKSRTFKRNLRKWLFMYVCTLGLLTSVITYSKYISQFMSKANEAVVAKFNVKINYLETDCGDITGLSSCNTAATRPLEKYNFYFSVDTSEVEVKADIVITPKITVTADNNFGEFTIEKICEVEPSKDGYTEIKELNNGSFTYTVQPEDTIKYFKIVLSHKINPTNESVGKNDLDVVSIGYSAEQID